MYCVNCGKELKEEWKSCPFCGVQLKEEQSNVENSIVNNKQTLSSESTEMGITNKEELKKYLCNSVLAKESGGVILYYGAAEIANDLIKVLNSNEKIEKLIHAHRNSLIGEIKNLRYFRNYIVKTNQRIIYIESGRRMFSLIPFLKKKIVILYPEIRNVNSDKRIGIFSGKLIVEMISNKKYRFCVANKKTADEFIESLSRNTY